MMGRGMQIAGVFENVDAAAGEWLRDFELPKGELRGCVVRVCSIAEAEVAFFFAKRTAPFHQRMVRHVTRALRKLGAKIVRVHIDSEGYARWLDAQEDKTDSELRRYRYATNPPAA